MDLSMFGVRLWASTKLHSFAWREELQHKRAFERSARVCGLIASSCVIINASPHQVNVTKDFLEDEDI